MNSLSLSVRRVVAFAIGAVIVAALMRRGFHIYGGIHAKKLAWER
jgi:hypothetical protein